MIILTILVLFTIAVINIPKTNNDQNMCKCPVVTNKDPLDDVSNLLGFPHEPMTLEDAEICDTERQIVFRDMWRCPNDISCKSCMNSSITRFASLKQALESNKDQRIQTINKHFSDRRSLVVAAVNNGQVFLLKNWLCSCKRLGIDPTSFTIIVPTDQEAENNVKALGLFTIDSQWVHQMPRAINANYNGKANVGGHSDINNAVLIVANEILQNTIANVLIQDVDVAWNSNNVLGFLENAAVNRDVLGMFSPFYLTKGGINTGFVFFRNTRKSRIFLQTVENIAPLKRSSDQELFNIVLRHYKFTQLEYRILPQHLFYKFNGKRRVPPGKDTLVYHAVGTNKEKNLRFHNMWFEC